MPILPIAQLTYLANPSAPSFVVGVPVLPTETDKPPIGSPTTGPMVEFINNFWPLWDATGGTEVADICGGKNGAIVGGVLAWGEAEYGQGIGAANVPAGSSITVPACNVSGGYSLERLTFEDDAWVHKVTVNDPDLNTNTVYINGVAQPSTEYSSDTIEITDLVVWDGEAVNSPFNIEYARIWNRALYSYEVADLYGNPYIMFGLTQELLDEIITIINFMKPMYEAWEFIYT